MNSSSLAGSSIIRRRKIVSADLIAAGIKQPRKALVAVGGGAGAIELDCKRGVVLLFEARKAYSVSSLAAQVARVVRCALGATEHRRDGAAEDFFGICRAGQAGGCNGRQARASASSVKRALRFAFLLVRMMPRSRSAKFLRSSAAFPK